VAEGWTKEQAIAEWTRGGFGFNDICRGLVKYFRKLDLAASTEEKGVRYLFRPNTGSHRKKPHKNPKK
jgi:hypothetical protein